MTTIKNFGFMWERDKVDWGHQARGAKAQFKGRQVGKLKRIVDFAEQMGIYVLYDKFEQPVQIGQSRNILRRLKEHRRDRLRNRWAYFSWFGFYKVGAKDKLHTKERTKDLKRTQTLEDSLNEIEAVLIQVLEPRLNRRGSNWQESEEYLQIDATDGEENDDQQDEAAT